MEKITIKSDYFNELSKLLGQGMNTLLNNYNMYMSDTKEDGTELISFALNKIEITSEFDTICFTKGV